GRGRAVARSGSRRPPRPTWCLARCCSPKGSVEGVIEQDVMAREGQFDAQQLLSRARLQPDGSLGKVLIAEPDLRRQAAAPKPAHAETGGALLTAGVDEKPMDPVLERIVRPK